jgi:hypothetical protein
MLRHPQLFYAELGSGIQIHHFEESLDLDCESNGSESHILAENM